LGIEDAGGEYPPVRVQTNAILGPLPPGDLGLIPLVGKAITILSSGGLNMLRAKPRIDPKADAARRITGLTALLAAGEARAVLVLVTTNLPMHARVHVRAIDELLRRISVYSRDPQLAKDIADSQDLYHAEGLAKLTPADRARISAADENIAQRVAALMAVSEKPVRITGHKNFRQAPAGLSEFERWAYSQVEHGTVIAAAEIANRSNVPIDDLYQSHDGDLLLWITGGLIRSIVAHFIAWGVQVRPEFDEMNARLEKIAANFSTGR
jgi:hypothetical protein